MLFNRANASWFACCMDPYQLHAARVELAIFLSGRLRIAVHRIGLGDPDVVPEVLSPRNTRGLSGAVIC